MLGLKEKKRQTHYFKPFITRINISAEINKGWWACLEDSCSSLRSASLERGLLGCHAYQPPVKPLHLFLIIHLERGEWRSCQGELRRRQRTDILFTLYCLRGKQGKKHVALFTSVYSVWTVSHCLKLQWCSCCSHRRYLKCADSNSLLLMGNINKRESVEPSKWLVQVVSTVVLMQCRTRAAGCDCKTTFASNYILSWLLYRWCMFHNSPLDNF